MGDKTVRISHLIYIIIIAVIILSNFLVISFGDLEDAGKIMGVAATVSSLILSAIAIVLSLIDVAGQRHSVVDLKETAENLQESNEDSQKLIEELVLKINNIDMIIQGLVQQIESIELRKEDLTELKDLISNENKGDLTKEDLQKRLDEIIEKEKQNYKTIEIIKNYNNAITNLKEFDSNANSVRRFEAKKLTKKLLTMYKIGQIISRKELYRVIIDLKLNSPTRQLINKLVEDEFIVPITNDGDKGFIISGKKEEALS